jgi:hypothetical protein
MIGEFVVAHSSSGEPSVNQLAPSFHPIEREASMEQYVFLLKKKLQKTSLLDTLSTTT